MGFFPVGAPVNTAISVAALVLILIIQEELLPQGRACKELVHLRLSWIWGVPLYARCLMDSPGMKIQRWWSYLFFSFFFFFKVIVLKQLGFLTFNIINVSD